MKILDELSQIWLGADYPFLIHKKNEIFFSELSQRNLIDISDIKAGDVVALIGDFNYETIAMLLKLIDLKVIVVPLTTETHNEHSYFFDSALVDFVIHNNSKRRLCHDKKNDLIEKLRALNHAGLVLFSTGTTGRPKAILHDLTVFLRRFQMPRPTLRTLSFLLFDHIGGINTLFHTLYNRGVVIAPESRTVDSILQTCNAYNVEVLPATPTFLRMLLLSGALPDVIPESLKVITYGTERMDQPTLDELCRLLPRVDFRQTYGMSELGIVRVKSESRDSLYMKIGGEGVEIRVVDNVLQIRSESRMLGYINDDSPFDLDGWYNTKDVVDVKDGFIKITGRLTDVINVGGLKFMASDVERVVLTYPGVAMAKVVPKNNPITGQHAELMVQSLANFDINKTELITYLRLKLPSHMVPKRVTVGNVEVGHRFKKK